MAAALLAGAAAACDATTEVDLLIRGGTVVDGTGAAGRPTDLAIVDGRILALGDVGGLRAAREIDATGWVVAPGFIDLHSHADLILLADRATQERLLGAKIAQGVTTVIVGNCGLGVAPSNAAAAEVLAGVNGWMTPDEVHAGPLRVGEYLERLQRGGLPLNVGTLAPHGPLRISASGLTAGPVTDGELQTMLGELAAALDQGAFGLSVGLIYPPGMYSPTSELVALAHGVAEADGLFTAHVRGSSETLLEATRELLEVARRSGARVHHSHLEAVGEPFWPDVARVLALEDRARLDGLRVSHDVFPYTRAATMMSAIFPPWALEGGIPALLERLAEPGPRARLRRELNQRVPEWPPWQPGGWPHNLVGAVGWDGIYVASVASGDAGARLGLSLAAIADDQRRDPFDVVADLMLAQRGRVGQLVDEISGRGERIGTLLEILAHPAASIVSDAEDYGRGVPHPAHAGAFVRALRLARERGPLSVEETVRRATSAPAALLGLDDLGVLRQGARADLVLFDARTVTDRATWAEPRRRAEGVAFVIVGGRIVVDDGRYLGGLHGSVLRSRNAADRD